MKRMKRMKRMKMMRKRYTGYCCRCASMTDASVFVWSGGVRLLRVLLGCCSCGWAGRLDGWLIDCSSLSIRCSCIAFRAALRIVCVFFHAPALHRQAHRQAILSCRSQHHANLCWCWYDESRLSNNPNHFDDHEGAFTARGQQVASDNECSYEANWCTFWCTFLYNILRNFHGVWN